jgi:acetyl-CoA acetyltransferase family protein
VGLAREVVIVDYLRSGFSRSRPKEPEKDLLNGHKMLNVLALLWKEMISRNKLDPREVDEAITATASPYMEHFTVGSKITTWLADLPFTVAGSLIEEQCGSSLNALRTLVMSIACGYNDVALGGGVEHMTHLPIDGSGVLHVSVPLELLQDPKYKNIDFLFSTNMGNTAQKLAEVSGISREAMDRFSLRSHQLATKGHKDGYFKGEIMPLQITLPDGTKQIFDYDANVRSDTTLEKLAALKPAYKPDGTLTAGNSSPVNAGASAMLVMSAEKAKKLGYQPLAKFVSFGTAGVDPTIMGSGAVPAAQKALKAAGLKVSDIDFWEINEAFAVVPLYAMKELNIPEARVNMHGGAVAIGHPLGCSGIRLAGTLARILKENKGKYGCATLCVGGGQGIATVIERV